MRMIGITGRAGSGKTFLANELKGMAKNVEIVSFAAQLRKEIEQVFGLPIPSLWAKPTSPEIRWILQQYGTQYRRAQDDDYWVKVGMQIALTFAQLARLVVFDDVRFPNEADAIRAEGGLIVRVYAPTPLREARLGTLPEEHASETSMDTYSADFGIRGLATANHDKQLLTILTEATLPDIDPMEGIRASFK